MYYGSAASDSESLSCYPLDTLSDEEIVKLVENLRKQVHILKLENEVLEKSIMRLDPTLMTGVQNALKYATNKPPGSSVETLDSFVKSQITKFGHNENLRSGQSRMSRKTDSGGKLVGSSVTRFATRINLNERLELLSITMEQLGKELSEWKKIGKTRNSLLKAQLESCELWIIDTEKSIQDFQEEVIIQGHDPLTKRIPAEVWISFMMEWSKTTDKKIDKMRLRNSTLNTQYRKLKDVIGVKAELSKNLTPVDFDKKKVENQVAVKVLETKKVQLYHLKAMVGDANLNLAIHKKTMTLVNTYLSKVRKLTTQKKRQTVIWDKESKVIELEVKNLEQRIKEIQKLRATYHIPNINEYVAVKEKKNELINGIKRLETRLNIKKIAVTSTHKQLRILLSMPSLGDKVPVDTDTSSLSDSEWSD